MGAGTLDWLNFEHCGVKHYQDKSLGELVQCMDHYVQQLRKIQSDELTLKSDTEASASVTLTACSLVCSVVWRGLPNYARISLFMLWLYKGE